MDNTEKGKLLGGLFPDALNGAVGYIAAQYRYLSDNQDSIRQNWEQGSVAFAYWYRIAANIASTFEKHGDALCKSSSLFAEQLFDGYNALFTIDCLREYTAPQDFANPKFAQMVDVLFNP